MPNVSDQIAIAAPGEEGGFRDRAFRGSAFVLSALAHLLIVLLLVSANVWDRVPVQPEPPIEVDIVPEPPAQREARPASEKAQPEPPKPEPPKPEPPKPAPPKPAPPNPAIEQPPPPPPQPESPPRQQAEEPRGSLLPPPLAPQLVKARIAEKSSAPQRKGVPDGVRSPPDSPEASAPGEAVTLSLAPQGSPDAKDEVGAVGKEGVALRQSEEDYVLAQILKYWRFDFRPKENPDGVLTAVIFIHRDGSLAPPLNKDAPWNPGSVIRDYPVLKRMGPSYERDILEGFYLALRLSQPLEIPGVDTARWPKRVIVRFKLKDVWQHTARR